MRILLTNDDGIDAQGLVQLAEKLESDGHDVWVLAPAGNRSAQSHAISLHAPLVVKEIRSQWFSCSGTPADTVLLALNHSTPFPTPELLISGINHGSNLGTDIIYSGTCAAAREAARKSIPAIATSLCKQKPPYNFNSAINFISNSLNELLEACNSGEFLNINFPEKINDDMKVIIAEPCNRVYNDYYSSYVTPNKETYYFIGGEYSNENAEENSDLHVVNRGHIALTSIQVQPQSSQNKVVTNGKLFSGGE